MLSMFFWAGAKNQQRESKGDVLYRFVKQGTSIVISQQAREMNQLNTNVHSHTNQICIQAFTF